MLLSIALIILVVMSLASISKKLKLPILVGMLLTGIILGPYVLNLLDPKILNISNEIRKIALIIILTRAGLGLDLSGLKRIGFRAILMCFVPATFEILLIVYLAPKVMGISYLEAAILGSVLAAVSPAVVVPRMVKLMDEKYGTRKGIPQLILAGSSVDDVYAIVLFSAFIAMIQGDTVSILSFINIPISIILGIIIGLTISTIIIKFFTLVKIEDTAKVLIVLSISFVLSFIEDSLNTSITFSSLIAIMFIGIGLQKDYDLALNLSSKYNKIWIGEEIFLFVLVGASVNINYLAHVGSSAFVLILIALVFRMLGVFVCLLKTDFNKNERIFTMLAYTPKATVQAAIGGIPLALGLKCGDLVLTIAVLAIVLTAPLGAFAIDLSYKKLLTHDN